MANVHEYTLEEHIRGDYLFKIIFKLFMNFTQNNNT